MKMQPRAAALILGIAIVLVACSSSAEDDAASTSSTSSTTATTTTVPLETTTSTTTEPPPPPLEVDYGADDFEIRVGASADLTGPRAQVSAAMIDGQIAFFDSLNDRGGIAERRIELIVRDHASDLTTHVDNFAELAERSELGVVILSATGDEEQTDAIRADMVEADLVGLTSSSAAAWSESGTGNVLPLGASTCVEAINAVEYLADRVVEQAEAADEETGEEPTPPTLAIVSRPGAYGREGALGARLAAEALGLTVVADLDQRIGPSAPDELAEELIDADPDIVWITASPPELAQLIVGATAGGLDARWAGSGPTYNSALLNTVAAPVLADRYLHSSWHQTWGTATDEMAAVEEELATALPEGTYDEADAYTAGWLQASVVADILIGAAERGDMTRAGVAAVASGLGSDMSGIAPEQAWSGSGDAFVRETYLYGVSPDDATLERTLREQGRNGLELLDGPFTGAGAAIQTPSSCRPPLTIESLG